MAVPNDGPVSHNSEQEKVAAADQRNDFGYPIGLQKVQAPPSSTVDEAPTDKVPQHGDPGDYRCSSEDQVGID